MYCTTKQGEKSKGESLKSLRAWSQIKWEHTFISTHTHFWHSSLSSNVLFTRKDSKTEFGDINQVLSVCLLIFPVEAIVATYCNMYKLV